MNGKLTIDGSEMTSEEKARARFEEQLLTRLKLRATVGGSIYTLDLRCKQFAGVGQERLTLYCPEDAEWPNGGRTTSDRVEATRWMREKYAAWLWSQVNIARSTPDVADLTWREGAQRYVDSLKLIERRGDGTVAETIPQRKRSRISMIRQHIVPQFGHLPMGALDREMAAKAAAGLTVWKSTGEAGKKRREPATHGTKLNFRTALYAIWNFNFPYRSAPFGFKIEAPTEEHGHSTEVFSFDDEGDLLDNATGALDPEQLKRVLVAAAWYDREMMARPNIRTAMVPNTAHTIAIQAALGTRISEQCNIRWGHIMSQKRYTVIHNAKVHQVLVTKRAVPLQYSLDPWLDELRAMDRDYQPNGFVIRTDPKAPANQPAAQTSIARRIATAFALAGLKQPKKATHGLRATFASLCDASPEIDEKMTRRYLGHQRVYGSSTDVYVRQLISQMRESHRHLIPLPTPAEVRAELERFTPAPLKSWKERRQPWRRSKMAREERNGRPKRVPLGASLERPQTR